MTPLACTLVALILLGKKWSRPRVSLNFWEQKHRIPKKQLFHSIVPGFSSDSIYLDGGNSALVIGF